MSYLLLVDDNEANRTSLAAHLESIGHHVHQVGDGQAALDAVARERVDLILLGVNIPKVDGFQVLQKIKSDAAYTRIPVIMLSSVADDQSIVRSLQHGAADFVAEPYNPVLLDARITAWLEREAMQESQEIQLAKSKKLVSQMEKVILPMGVALSSERNFDRLLERILTEAKNVCNADAGTLYLRTPENTLRFAIVMTDSLGIKLGGTSGNPVLFPPLQLYNEATGEANHQNVATHSALTSISINIPDIYASEGFDFSGTRHFDQLNHYRSVSILTVPLKDNQGVVIGVLQLLNARSERGQIIAFDDYSRLVVESLSSQAAVVLNNHLLVEHRQLMVKLENDIQIARRIQSNFLPTKMPAFQGWEIDGRFQPAREVAGDFYDVFTMMNGKRIGFMLGDVCDKGVGAALFMSLTRSLIRAFAMQNHNINWADSLFDDLTGPTGGGGRTNSRQMITANALKTAVVNTNDYITEHHLDLNMFATLFCGMLDPNTGSMFYINGGHPSPIILSPTCQIKARLEPTGTPVGMFPDAEYTIETAQLDHGDILLVFSDGATDARNPAGKFFQEAGLLSLLSPQAESVHALLDRIEGALSNYISSAVQFDDITLLAIKRM